VVGFQVVEVDHGVGVVEVYSGAGVVLVNSGVGVVVGNGVVVDVDHGGGVVNSGVGVVVIDGAATTDGAGLPSFDAPATNLTNRSITFFISAIFSQVQTKYNCYGNNN
jgi:hypothetical protein